MQTYRRPRKRVPIITILFVLTVSAILIRKVLIKPAQSDQILPAQSQTALFTPSPLTSAKNKKKEPLLPQIEAITSKKNGTFSVYVVELATGKEYAINKEMVVDGASVNKIPILAAIYHQAGEGEIDLEKIIVLQPDDIQNYGSGSIQYDSPGTPYSIKTLARLMMEKSDNTAAYILGSQVMGLDTITALNKVWGLTQTDMYKNSTSNKDIAIVLTKMFRGEITSPALTAEMLDFMNTSDFDDRIPRNLPEGTVVYHKTGDQVGKIHDAGIVALAGKPYYIGVFTTDMTDVESTKETIGEISKVVFDYMR